MNVMMSNLTPAPAQIPNLHHDEDDMSDISEEDDFHQGPSFIAAHDPRKKTRIIWTTDKEDYLLRCYNHYRRTSSSEHGLKGKSWRRIAIRMTNQFLEEYDSKSCRNKLNVLRYDYMSFKEVVEAKASGNDNDNFWHAITEKYPRSSRWRDSDYPHAELMRKIFDLNGEGVDAIPDSDGEQLLANSKTPASKKRSRESYGVATSPKHRRQSAATVGLPVPMIEDVLSKVVEKMHKGFSEILDELKKRNDVVIDPRKLAMDELNKERYLPILSDAPSREILFNVFKDSNLAKDFVYYPDNFKINFLQDILVKHSSGVLVSS